MTNVIDFLERLGRDARLRRASGGEMEVALDGEQLDLELRQAILAGDPSALGQLLGRGQGCCLLIPAEEEEGGNEREEEDSPSREDEERGARVAFPVAAARV